MKSLLLSLLFAVAACGQTATALNPMWSVSLGTDWTGVQCDGRNNLAGWMWGYVQKDAAGVPHIKLDYCDAASGVWQTIVWDNAAAPAVQFSDAEIPAGVIDGKNATFTLAHAPVSGSVPIVALNGVIQKLNGDYKLAAAVFTFGAPPSPGDTLTVWYRY